MILHGAISARLPDLRYGCFVDVLLCDFEHYHRFVVEMFLATLEL